MSQYNTPMSDGERNALKASLKECEDGGIAAHATAAQAYLETRRH
jgi:hypothetical protein